MWRSSLSKDDGVTPYTLDLRAKYGDPLVLDESLVGDWTVIKIGSSEREAHHHFCKV